MQTPPTQREYWNSRVGDDWAAQADKIDVMLEPISQAALDKAEFAPGERVLDIGCGSGATTLAIARRVGDGGSLVGVDLSTALLNLARKRAEQSGAQIDFVEADAGAATFGKPFDVAFSRFGIMFFDAPAAAFAHIRQGMSSGGRIVFVCWRASQLNRWAMTPIEAIMPMLKAPLTPPDPNAPGPFAFADGDKIQRTLKESGWSDIAVTPWDGDILVGGGGGLAETADFLLRIGPCARVLADQDLDRAEMQRRIVEKMSPFQKPNGVSLAAACWIVTARA